tara:strand:- start:944 stop:1288 length:345 start_codon:yes stop_codon:yes gene_type:complete
MTKLKTLFLLLLAGFILVGCGDPRAEDKKLLVDSIVLAQMATKDEAECAVDALSDNLSDKAWEGMMLEVNGTADEKKAWEDSVTEEDEVEFMKEFITAGAATLQCDGVDMNFFN